MPFSMGSNMANRRMFAKSIIDTDYFLEMPATTQLLYFHLAMRADDDGFVSSPKRILRMVGSSEDDFKVLISKQFIIPFDSGVCVIKHWRIHNLIRGDRYQETIYTQEKSMLIESENKSYEVGLPYVIPEVNPVKVSIGKDSKDKYNIPPSVQEVEAYCKERKNGIDAEHFMAFYEARGWMLGKSKMKNWKSAVITWEKNTRHEKNNDVRVTKTAWEEMNES